MPKKDPDVSIADSMQKLRDKGWDGEVIALMSPSDRKSVHEAERRGIAKKASK
jgi:hypothetical protein